VKLKDGMLLFHGSYMAIEKIDLDKCSNGRDFGKGFYLTSSAGQARGFIRSSIIKAQNLGIAPLSQNYGFVSSFRYHEPADGIKTFEFPEADREWLWFIAQNRRRVFATALSHKIDPAVFNAEIIMGKVANDKTNPVILTYLNGLYGDIHSERAVQIAIEELLPNKLEDQFCFLTEKAVDCLEFQEARKYVL